METVDVENEFICFSGSIEIVNEENAEWVKYPNTSTV